MDYTFFALPGNETLAEYLAIHTNGNLGEATIRSFSDGESYVKLNGRVANKQVALVCSMDNPNSKILPLIFMAKAVRDHGASRVVLIAPYLAYMRQDYQFSPGECITSTHFAELISQTVDSLITVDPHLHRHSSLDELYSIPTKVLYAQKELEKWIMGLVDQPLIIATDSARKDWVKNMAKRLGCPFAYYQNRTDGGNKLGLYSDESIDYQSVTPIMVEDIISDGKTMMAANEFIQKSFDRKPICVGIHGIFAGNAYNQMIEAGLTSIITSNTIIHQTNEIDIWDSIVMSLKEKIIS